MLRTGRVFSCFFLSSSPFIPRFILIILSSLDIWTNKCTHQVFILTVILKTVSEAGVAMVTTSFKGLMMSPCVHWRFEVPSKRTSVRYSSHFPFATSFGQSNSTSSSPRRPRGFPWTWTCWRTPGYTCPLSGLERSGSSKQTWKVKTTRLPTSSVLFMARSPTTWPPKKTEPGLILTGNSQRTASIKLLYYLLWFNRTKAVTLIWSIKSKKEFTC